MSVELIPINKAMHLKTKIKASNSFDHVKNQHLTSLCIHEISQAASYYPVVFIKDSGADELRLVAALGLQAGENLFYQTGTWHESYIPVNVLRYPFGAIGSNQEEKGFTVCIDKNSKLINESVGHALFDENGGESEYLTSMVKYLTDVITKEILTKKFIEELVELNLLKSNAFTLTTVTGEKHKIDGVYTVDEEKLKNLTDEQVLSFHKRGFFSTIYSHLTSLAQFNRLVTIKSKLDAINRNSDKKIITH
tara:strand:- start:437 stop:1186 length:750 start_codon:yes stop_codon:yes gene_type:complete